MATEVLESGEILRDDNVDKSLKQDLENLAKNINVKEVSSDKVDALFSKLDSVDAEAKNRALQYALKNSKIMVGNTEKSVVEIAEAFDKAVEQDWSTWKIKVKEGVAQEDKDLVEWFLNEKWSSLAYLIQLSSQKASLQASRWYWKSNADKIIDVGADKVFWNQTRRALSWLREWIEWDYTKNVETMDVENFKVEDVLKLKFISSALKTRIETEAKDENVKWLWSNGNYELKSKYTNNFALKEKVITVDDPKREENKQYVESNVGDKKVKVYTVTSLEELPAWYKWKDPENYDEKNKDTYPKVYNLSVDGVKYSFYSNWRCHNGADNKMYNTRDIVDRLKNGWWKKDYSKISPEYTSDNITTEEMKSYVETIKEKCTEALKIWDNESLGVSYDGKKLKFTLWTWEKQIQYMWTTTYWSTMTTSVEQILSDTFDIKECLKWWNTEDPDYWNIDVDYVEKVMIKSAKEKLVNQKKAIKWQRALVAKYREKKNGLTLEDLFKWDSVLNNNRKKWRLNTFFSKFDDKKLVLDKDTTYEWDTIKLEFDDSWGNESYNVRKNNNGLKIKADKIVKDDYTIDEPKFKKELKTIILNIIEREDFK